MPKFKKQTISRYIKTDCKRFLALELYRDTADKSLASQYNMPEPIVARPTATIFARAGVKAEKPLYSPSFVNEEIEFENTIDLCVNYKVIDCQYRTKKLHIGYIKGKQI